MISIIVPVFNVEKYIEKCLESLTKQTYKDLEILLIDDGSNDNSGKICDLWKKNDERIKVIHQKNGGIAAARNRGLDCCTGDYIAFVDPDDYVDLEMYEKLLQAISRENADVAMCHEIAFEKEHEYIEKKKDVTYIVEYREMFRDHFNDDFRGSLTWVWNKLYSRELIGNIRFCPYSAMEDTAFMVMISQKVEKCVDIGERLYYYRQRSGSTMKNKKEEVFQDYVKVTLFEYEVLNTYKDKEFKYKHLGKCLCQLFQIECQCRKLKYGKAEKEAREGYNKIYEDIQGLSMSVNRVKLWVYRYLRFIGFLINRNTCV